MSNLEVKRPEDVKLSKFGKVNITTIGVNTEPHLVGMETTRNVVNSMMWTALREFHRQEEGPHYCYVVPDDDTRALWNSRSDSANDLHDIDVNAYMYSSLIKDAYNLSNKTWVVMDGKFKGRQFSYSRDDYDKGIAEVTEGYILNYLIRAKTQNVDGDVYLKFCKRGKYLKPGDRLHYILCELHEFVNHPGYGYAVIREIFIDVDGITIGGRFIEHVYEKDIIRDMDYQQNYELDIDIQQDEEYEHERG